MKILNNVIKNEFMLIAFIHTSVCTIIAFTHGLTARQVIFFNTGGISIGDFMIIFVFLFQLPLLLLCSHLSKKTFIETALTANSCIALFSLICQLIEVDRIFIIISTKTGFLSFLFCLLYLYTVRKNIHKIKRFALFGFGYFVFVAMMLTVPYSMKIFQVSWLFFLD